MEVAGVENIIEHFINYARRHLNSTAVLTLNGTVGFGYKYRFSNKEDGQYLILQ